MSRKIKKSSNQLEVTQQDRALVSTLAKESVYSQDRTLLHLLGVDSALNRELNESEVSCDDCCYNSSKMFAFLLVLGGVFLLGYGIGNGNFWLGLSGAVIFLMGSLFIYFLHRKYRRETLSRGLITDYNILKQEVSNLRNIRDVNQQRSGQHLTQVHQASEQIDQQHEHQSYAHVDSSNRDSPATSMNASFFRERQDVDHKKKKRKKKMKGRDRRSQERVLSFRQRPTYGATDPSEQKELKLEEVVADHNFSQAAATSPQLSNGSS